MGDNMSSVLNYENPCKDEHYHFNEGTQLLGGVNLVGRMGMTLQHILRETMDLNATF
jgi:hypothetical protein